MNLKISLINGIRLELTAQIADDATMTQHSQTAHQKLEAWQERKQQHNQHRVTLSIK